MTTIFDTSPTAWVQPLLLLTLAALVALLLLGARNAHLARIALRNVPRRKLRTALIIFGLMLGTTFIAAAFAVDDAIALGVRTIAVYNLGRIDEEVLGGDGPLSAYSQAYGARVVDGLRDDPQVAGVAPALLVQDLLLADETSSQVRGRVGALAMDPQGGGALVDLRAASGNAPAPIDALAPDEVYLNRNAATLLNAHVGDALTLYSSHWPGKRYSARVREIVTGGPLGDPPSIVLPLATLQRYADAPNQINRIYIANAGDGLTGVARTDAVTDKIYQALYSSGGRVNRSTCSATNGTIICSAVVNTSLYVHKAKQDGVRFALQAQEIFGRILTLFTLFALAIGLLLIFLIFTLLAAERRAELGMARALGMRRLAIAQTLLFEGAAYNLVATLLGLLAGLGLGAAIVTIINPVVARTGYPLKLTVDASSMAVAFCLGLLFTLATILLAAWTVSRMTVAAALRDLPEPPAPQPSLARLFSDVFSSAARFFVAPGMALRAWGALLLAFVTRGPAPLLLGVVLLQRSRETQSLFTFSLGLSFALVGLALLLRALALAVVIYLARRYRPQRALRIAGRATLLADRLTALVVGGGLALYWALPFDTLQNVGLPRFSGGIEVFFVAGVMMVLGAVLALAPNLDLLLAPCEVAALAAGAAAPRDLRRAGLSGVSALPHRDRAGALLAGLLHDGRDGVHRGLGDAELRQPACAGGELRHRRPAAFQPGRRPRRAQTGHSAIRRPTTARGWRRSARRRRCRWGSSSRERSQRAGASILPRRWMARSWMASGCRSSRARRDSPATPMSGARCASIPEMS